MVRARKDQNQAVQLARGLPQGERKMLKESQRAIPLPNNQNRLQDAITATQGMESPDILTQPTNNPGEPPTAGLLSGPGAGPGAIQPIMAPPGPDESGLAAYLPMLERLADDPSATSATRNFVRLMRGSIPPSITQESMVNGVPR